MKKKIFSTLLVLVLLCMPMLCLTGCQSDPGNGVKFNVTTDKLDITQGTSFVNCGLGIELNYQLQKWNSKTSQYEYVIESTTEPSGYEFVGTTPQNYFAGGDITDLNKALAHGLTYSGYDTTTKTGANEVRILTVTFSGISHKVEYTVK